jgi:hypothetical protein
MLAIFVCSAAYAALELYGSWKLGLAFWRRMPSWGRVLLLVAIFAVEVGGALFLVQYLGALEF